MKKKKINIRFEDWDYECGDGCCHDWGTDIFINGERLDFRGISMEYGIEAVLTHLGYEVKVG